MTALQVVPVTFEQACQFVTMWHRHHTPPVGHKFSLGVAAGESRPRDGKGVDAMPRTLWEAS